MFLFLKLLFQIWNVAKGCRGNLKKILAFKNTEGF